MRRLQPLAATRPCCRLWPMERDKRTRRAPCSRQADDSLRGARGLPFGRGSGRRARPVYVDGRRHRCLLRGVWSKGSRCERQMMAYSRGYWVRSDADNTISTDSACGVALSAGCEIAGPSLGLRCSGRSQPCILRAEYAGVLRTCRLHTIFAVHQWASRCTVTPSREPTRLL